MEFERGGLVQGPASTVPIIAHAGEYVVTPTQLAALRGQEHRNDEEGSE